MKRSLLVVVLAMFAVAPAAAQDENTDSGSGGYFSDMVYSMSIGLGGGIPDQPAAFKDEWNPNFGALFGFGVGKDFYELSLSFDYNFFLKDGAVPDDQNVLMTQLNLKVAPFDYAASPYGVAGAGIMRAWRVDSDITEVVRGWSYGGGVDFEVSDTQHMLVEGRLVEGRTRKTPEKANTRYIQFRVGLLFLFE